MDTSKYKKLFLQESGEHLKNINNRLLSLGKEPAEDTENTDSAFRSFHSVKGMAASMGYEPITILCHKLEGLLDAMRQNVLPLSQGVTDTLLKGSAVLGIMLETVSDDRPVKADLSPLLDEIDMHLKGGVEKKVAKHGPQKVRQALSLILPTTVRVDASIFDTLIADIGEFLRIKSRIHEIANEMHNFELSEHIHVLNNTILEMYETTVSARMIPLEDLMQNLPLIVRDISMSRGKDVEFSMHGVDIEVDRAVLNAIGEPLVHLIRNAIDHGIETPDEREKRGKPGKGEIKITASRESDFVTIEVVDDGMGIDHQRVKERAVEMGVSAEKIEGMCEEEVLSLICLPGLSLSREVTDISGRGVGMDVVKKNVEAIGGRFEIKSVINKGTRFILKIPFTAAIIKVLMVYINDMLLCFPVTRVESALQIQMSDIKSTENGISVLYRDMDIPVFDLSKIFNVPCKGLGDIIDIVVINHPDKKFGVLVDGFKGVFDVYIKPLPAVLQGMRGISGFTVTGEGDPVLVMDVANIRL